MLRRGGLLAVLIVGCGATGGEAIEIVVDRDGVPHVYAPSDEAAFYGVGYQTAVDRLYQLEMIRRFALGRRAEVLGEDGLADDRLARFADLSRWGRADFALTEAEHPERARLIRAWVDGINRRIEEVRRGRVDPPFGFAENDFLPEPWAYEDPYVILKGAGLANDRSIEFEVAVTLLTQLFPDAFAAIELFRPAYPNVTMPPEGRVPLSAPGPAPAVPRATGPRWEDLDEESRANVREALGRLLDQALRLPKLASNNWAIAGEHTDSGRPMIAGDPHLAFDFFGSPYPLHFSSREAGGRYDVAGIVYPGTPGITMGGNDRIAWAVTTAALDVTDIWQVEREAGGVRMGDAVVPLTRREEAIIVREEGQPAGVGRTVNAVYQDVEGYGVLLPRELAMGIPLPGDFLVSWTGFKARPLRWFLEVNDAATLDDFDAAVDRSDEQNYNYLGASADGITYRVGTEVPDRAEWSGPRAPWKAMQGDDAGSLWTGAALPPDRLPRARDPERGWLATANNDPFGFTLDGSLDGDPWYLGALFEPGYRAHRVEEELTRLTSRGAVTLDEMTGLQTDSRSTLADGLLPLLGEAHGRVATDAALAEFRGDADLDRVVALLVDEWDRRMTRDSSGAVAFHAFLHFVAEGALRDDVAVAYDFAVELLAPYVFKIADLALRGVYPDGDRILQRGDCPSGCRDLILLDAARATTAWLGRHFGGVDPAGYRYEDVKVTSFQNALGAGFELFTHPSDGGEDTVNVSTNMAFDPDVPMWVTTWVAVERHVATFDPDGRPALFYTTPFVGPADPDSALNQGALSDYIEGRYRRLLTRRDEIEAAAVSRTTITR
jgi:penicillin amidase